MKKILTSFLLITLTCVSLFAAKQPYFIGSCDKDALAYKVGEQMKFAINLVDKDGNIIEGQKLKWEVRKDGGAMESGYAVSAKAPLEIKTSMDKAGFVWVKVVPVNEKGNYIKTMDKFEGGACADFDNIKQITPEPEDFDAFWEKQLSALDKVPMNCERKSAPTQKGFKTYILTIDCVGKPTKAYLTIPENAKEKSLPIIIRYHGYGVSRIPPIYTPDAITFSVARHSYELGKPAKYYEEQKKLLKGFGLRKENNLDPEQNYFKFMILRDVRALQYAKTLPEWNGKDITVRGGSMGGFQSIFVAALDKDVTLCLPNIPWMCNLNAKAEKKQNALFQPDYIPQILYFDSTNAAKRVKCKMEITARLGDYVCPPSGVTILYHNAPNATLTFYQNGTHPYTSPWKDNPSFVRNK